MDTPTAAGRGSLRVIACPRPFSIDRLDFMAPVGGTVAELIGQAGMQHDRVFARVFLDDRLIPQAEWERVVPEAGQMLTVRVVPTGGGGGGKDTLRIVAMIAIIALAVAAPYMLPAAWGLTATTLAGGTTLTLSGSLVGMAISIVGSMALNALIPPPAPKQLTHNGKGRQHG